MPAKDPEKNKIYKSNYYQRNKELCLKRSRESRKRATEWLMKYKSTLSCTRCDENHPACLQFHHIDRHMKKKGIADIARNGSCIETLKAEIAKCVVLCANCHFKEHYGEKF